MSGVAIVMHVVNAMSQSDKDTRTAAMVALGMLGIGILFVVLFAPIIFIIALIAGVSG